MDKAIEILQKLTGSLTLQQKINFIRVPMIISWLLTPLALYGYIVTKDMLLFYSTCFLFVINLVISFVAYYFVSVQSMKEMKLAFASLDNTISHLKKQVESLAKSIKKTFMGNDDEEPIEVKVEEKEVIKKE
jgi:hypothetical protein